MKIDQKELQDRAFGDEPVEEVSSEKDTAEESQTKSVEEKDVAASEPESVVEEQKVPYSRLKSVVERARLAEQRAEEATRRLDSLERNRSERANNEPYAEAISSRIKKLYGDNETSREIIEIEISHHKELEEIAERKAYEALDKRESMSKAEIESNERALESKLEDFSLQLGRELTDKEQQDLLEIADKYSATGEDGRYISGEPLPFDRAWEIYEMKLASQGQSAKKTRSKATELTSSKSDGETNIESVDADKWYPGRWRDRINKK